MKILNCKIADCVLDIQDNIILVFEAKLAIYKQSQALMEELQIKTN